MSGHSKWATIKHKKGAVDKARGKLFNKIARQLEVAAREGGGDPNTNATLRTMMQKAKAGQMTNDAIDRAIKRGTGEHDGGTYESITYEGYAPGGVALLIDVLTDNRNRTGAEVRNVFSKLGGSMAEPGAVGWQFSREGVLHVPSERRRGRRDARRARRRRRGRLRSRRHVGDHLRSRTSSTTSRRRWRKRASPCSRAESTMISSTTIEVTDPDAARKVLRIIDALEDNDDVQDVFGNFDISEELMEAVG